MAGFIEKFSAFPGLDAILEIEGLDVIDVAQPAQLTGVGVGTACLVAEFTKYQPEPVEVFGAADVKTSFGPISKNVGTKSTVTINGKTYLRWDGNGNLLIAKQKFKRLVLCAVDDSVGKVDFSRTKPGLATTKTGTGTFNLYGLTSPATVVLRAQEDNAKVVTTNLTFVAAVHTSAAATSFEAANTKKLKIKVGPVVAGAIPVGQTFEKAATAAELSLDTWLQWFNDPVAFPGLSMQKVDADTVKIVSDVMGSDSGFEILASSDAEVIAALDLTLGVYAGSGNVKNHRFVTADELKTAIDAAIVAAGGTTWMKTAVEGAVLSVSSLTDGATSRIECQAASTADLALGGDFATNALKSGGTGTASAMTIFAGEVLTDNGGTKKFELMEDAFFDVDVLSVTGKKVRCLADATTVNGAEIVKFVSTFTGEEFTGLAVTNPDVTVARATTEAQWATLYQTAIDKLLSQEKPASEVNIVASGRVAATDGTATSGTIQKAIAKIAKDKAANGRGCIAVVSPPLGTTKTNAKAASGVGVAVSLLGRHERVVYAYPGVQYFFKDLVSLDVADDGICDIPSCVPLMSLISQLAPERNPGQATSTQFWHGLEAAVKPGGTIGPFTIDDYKSFRANGICAPRLDPAAGPIFQSGVTSVDPLTEANKRNINRIRFSDYFGDTLSAGLILFSKELGSQENQNAVTAIIESFCLTLLSPSNPKFARIASYSVDPKSGNTDAQKALGIFVWNIAVKMLATMDNIVLQAEVGPNVTPNVQAIS